MCLFPIRLKMQGITVPCGKCFECRMTKTREWTARIIAESRFHKDSCFLTLTYNDDNLPECGKLFKPDYQKFLKRLRRRIGKFRYFMSGEYGGKNKRPHYHIIIFGWKPDDCRFFFSRDGQDIYRSSFIESLWSKGFSTVGLSISSKTVKYVAKYLQKDIFNDFGDKLRPFISMSLRPGIGFNAIKPELLFTDKLYYEGSYVKLPRYFLKVLEREYPTEVANIKIDRLNRFLHSNYNVDYKTIMSKREKWLRKFGKRVFDKWVYNE